MSGERSGRGPTSAADVECYHPGPEIDLPPLQLKSFGSKPPPDDVREHERPFRVVGQMALDRLKLGRLDEAGADVVLTQHGDVGDSLEPLALHGQGKRPLQRAQLKNSRAQMRKASGDILMYAVPGVRVTPAISWSPSL